MGIIKKIFGYLFEIIIIIFVIGMTTILLCTNEFGYTEVGDYTVVTVNETNNSYLPNYKPGDLVVLKNINYDKVNINDVLYYYEPAGKVYVVSSDQVIKKSGDNLSSLYVFKGDTKMSVSNERIAGTSYKTYAGYGQILEFLESTAGFLLCVILPILLLFIYNIYHLVIIIKTPRENEENNTNKENYKHEEHQITGEKPKESESTLEKEKEEKPVVEEINEETSLKKEHLDFINMTTPEKKDTNE